MTQTFDRYLDWHLYLHLLNIFAEKPIALNYVEMLRRSQLTICFDCQHRSNINQAAIKYLANID